MVDREDTSKSNLHIHACGAISMLIQNAAPDVLLQLLHTVIDRLEISFNMPALTNEDRVHKEGVQGLLCGLIQGMVMKSTKEEIHPYCDTIMTYFIKVLQIENAACHEEAFSAISAIANILKGDFEKYMAALRPFLIAGLKNFEECTVCIVAVGLLADICRATKAAITPSYSEIMDALVEALQNSSLHRSLKPHLLGCFGVIALAFGAEYEPYLDASLMILSQAALTQVPDDDDLIDYVNTLRVGILEAYTGIVRGLTNGNLVDRILPCMAEIFGFIEMLAENNDIDYAVLRAAVGLVIVISDSFGDQIRAQIMMPHVMKLLEKGYATPDPELVKICKFAFSLVQKSESS